MDSIKIYGVIEHKIYKRFDSMLMRALTRILGFHDPLKVKFLERFGEVREAWVTNNLITSAGKAQIALLAGDASAIPFTYLAVGTSSTAPAVGNTTLGAEIVDSGFERAAATVSRVTTTVTNDTLQLLKAWTATGSKTIEEIGIFNAASSGTMLGRSLTTTRAFTTGETYTATYKVIFA